MKLYKLITFGLALSAMVLTSCRDNDYPTFNDADAFVAMQSAAYVVGEKDNSIEIPVMLTSLSGLEKTVEFTITPDSVAGAVEGTHFTLENESKSLTFTKDQPTQTIKLKIIDNNSYDGNVKFNISLAKTEGLNLGANSNCVVTIRDDEHPLAAFLGTYSASADLALLMKRRQRFTSLSVRSMDIKTATATWPHWKASHLAYQWTMTSAAYLTQATTSPLPSWMVANS